MRAVASYYALGKTRGGTGKVWLVAAAVLSSEGLSSLKTPHQGLLCKVTASALMMHSLAQKLKKMFVKLPRLPRRAWSRSLNLLLRHVVYMIIIEK